MKTPEYIFRFSGINKKQYKKIKKILKESFGDNILVIVANNDFSMHQLNDDYTKII